MASTRLVARVVSKKTSIRPTRAAITLTPAAVTRVKEILKDKPDMKALKIGVKTRGCSGLSYTLDYVNQKASFDEEVDQDGAKIYIDSKAQLTLLGTVMDYVDDKLSSEFVFENPNVTGYCGCGESFSIGKNSDIKNGSRTKTNTSENT